MLYLNYDKATKVQFLVVGESRGFAFVEFVELKNAISWMDDSRVICLALTRCQRIFPLSLK